ncbi:MULTISPECIES: hypothetical protein [unclassified Streptomyces]|uniref:hypothetical protein n=1 Tax=unclassified Streptomyces TaxID=2593676 RepID=UPI003319788E
MNPEREDPHPAELAALFDAAGRPNALDPAAEERALRAFRAARADGAHAPASRWRRRGRDDWRSADERRWARSLKVLLAGLVAAAALGGVAVAAGEGAIPLPFRGGAEPKPGRPAPAVPGADGESVRDDRPERTPRDSEQTPPGTEPAPRDMEQPPREGEVAPREEEEAPRDKKQAPGTTERAPRAREKPVPPASPGPPGEHPGTAQDTAAHCRAHLAAAKGRGKALGEGAAERLERAAGGREAVPEYCEKLLAGERRGKAGASPAKKSPERPAKPKVKPKAKKDGPAPAGPGAARGSRDSERGAGLSPGAVRAGWDDPVRDSTGQ